MPQKGPMLCSAQCHFAPESLLQFITTPSACSTQPPQGLRNVHIFETYCKNATLATADPAASCSTGTQNEAKYCGWETLDLAVPNCKAIPTDTCCIDFLARIASAASSTPSANAPPTMTFVGVAAGAVGILLLVLAIVYYQRTKKCNVLPVTKYTEKRNTLKSEVAAVSMRNSTHDTIPKNIIEENQTDHLAIIQNTALTTVSSTFTVHADDELNLVIGQDVYIIEAFDDGWALGYDPLTGKQGALPLVCCASYSNRLSGIGNRESSREEEIGRRALDEKNHFDQLDNKV